LNANLLDVRAESATPDEKRNLQPGGNVGYGIAAFTPIEFRMRNLPLASVDIVIVWSTIIWSAVAVWPHYRWIAVAQVPYFVWVSIASVLQLSITWMNWAIRF